MLNTRALKETSKETELFKQEEREDNKKRDYFKKSDSYSSDEENLNSSNKKADK